MYDDHKREYDSVARNAEKTLSEVSRLQSEGDLNDWRHYDKLSPLGPLVDEDPTSTWLTVGDGRFGSDGINLKKLGAAKVTCSDLNSSLLAASYHLGAVDNYSEENAEALSFADNSFSYVVIKEALHHLPRPYLGLYEMYRVSTDAIVLIEPNDRHINRSIADTIFDRIQQWRAGSVSNVDHKFEEVGNYVYTISRREIEKLQLGLGGRYVAILLSNDAYSPSLRGIKRTDSFWAADPVQKKMQLKLLVRQLLWRLLGLQTEMISAILFKKTPSLNLRERLIEEGWKIIELPGNPYRIEENYDR